MSTNLPTRPVTGKVNEIPVSLVSGVLTAERFRTFSPELKKQAIKSLSYDEATTLLYNWEFWRRENQAMPEGDWWSCWLILAGRGFGKTRIGAETVRYWKRRGFSRINLIGPTADDIRDAMIEGESGILAICPDNERPLYLPSRRQLRWPDGDVSLLFSAEEPNRLRNKQHEKLWCDEVAAWRYTDAWDQAMFGLRLGNSPQVVATTTPRPTKLIKELIASPTTVVTRGTTYQNRENLAPSFYAKVITKYEGTRLGRQELQAEVLDDNPNALFQQGNIDANRTMQLPPTLQRIVIGVDPAASSNETSDETGITAVGMDNQNPPHFFVLEDSSLIATPDGWAKAAVKSYHTFKADRIVGEQNNGGEMVEACIHHADVNVSYKGVHASRGKVIRAEPVAALYEQGRVHHVGTFSKLEDQMTDFNPATYNRERDPSPDRMDALVWAITELADNYSGWGLLELATSGELTKVVEQIDQMAKITGAKTLAKPVIPDNGFACPQCQEKLIVTIGLGYRCQSCGHQWTDKKQESNQLVGMRNQLLQKLRVH